MFDEDILSILSDVLEISKDELRSLDKQSPLENIGFTSLKFVQAIVRLEKTFGIEINDSDLVVSNFSTLSAISSMIEKYLYASPKKVLITDCDNVLWRGISGEEDLSIDDTSKQYQELLIKLYKSGIIICICSKNEKEYIDEAFKSAGMILKKENILETHSCVINKAECILSISNALKLYTDSFVFVDDSDYELGLVKASIPDVATIKFDRNDSNLFLRIQSFFCTGNSITDRTKLYVEQKQREKVKLDFLKVNEYNLCLETVTKCEITTFDNSERIAELSRRTTQFNLSGAHYSDAEITKIINDESYKVISLSVSDKYGDMGIIGAAILYIGEKIIIKAFMLSCRAFDRNFENILISKVKEIAGNKPIFGVFCQNDRNKKYSSFYLDNGIDVL